MTTDDLRFTIRQNGSEKELRLESLIDGKLFEWYERDEGGQWSPTSIEAATFFDAVLRAVEEWGEICVGRQT